MRLCLALLTLFAAASTADAAVIRGTFTSAERALAARVAAATWPSSPCHDREQVLWRRGRDLDALYPAQAAEARIVGLALQDGSCRVLIAIDRLSPYLRDVCRLLAHEFGHLAGADHEANLRAPACAGVRRKRIRTSGVAYSPGLRYRGVTESRAVMSSIALSAPMSGSLRDGLTMMREARSSEPPGGITR